MSKKLLLLLLLGFYVTAVTLTNNPTDNTLPSGTADPQITILGDSSCRIESQITLSELKTLWDFNSGFQARELNNLNDQQAAAGSKNPSSLGQPIIINNYMNTESQSVPISKVAQLLNKKPEEIASQFGRPVTGLLTKSEAQALAETPQQQNSILGLFPSSPSVNQKANPIDQYLVKLPSGKTVSLAAFENMVPLNTGTCLINKFMDAQISYVGVTDKNYYLGFHKNFEVKKESHISSSTTNAILSLAKDGKNMIVPEFYRNTQIFFSTWDTVSTILNWGLASKASANVEDTKAGIEQINKKLAFIEKQSGTISKAEAEIRASTATITGLQNDLTVATRSASVIPTLESQITSLKSKKTLSFKESESLKQFESDLAAANLDKAKLSKIETDIKGAEATQARWVNERDNDVGIKNKETTTQLQDEEKNLNQLGKVAALQVKAGVKGAARGIILGFAFLGPARYLYTINEAILFSSNDFNENDPVSLKNNYIKVFAQNTVLADFREATNQLLLGLGGLEEFVAGTTGLGVPSDAFSTGPMYIVNEPLPSQTKGSSTSSFATGPNNHWIVNTNWKGSSDFQTFEKINQLSGFARVSVEANQLPPDILLKRANIAKTESALLILAIPFMFSKEIPAFNSRFVNLLPFLLTTNLVLTAGIDNYKVSQYACKEKDIQTFKDLYLAMVLLDTGQNWFLPKWQVNSLSKWTKSPNGLTSFKKNTANLFAVTSPFSEIAWYLSSRMEQYASTCYDQKATIASWQELKSVPDASATSKFNDALKPINNLLNKTLLGGLFSGVGDPLAGRDELINLKASFDDQQSNLELKNLYYMHVDAGSTQWHGLLNNANNKSCFERLQGNGDIKISPADGIELKRNGNTVANFNTEDWKKRAAFSKDDFDFGRTIIPNRLVSFQFSCPNPFIIDSKGNIQGNPACPEVNCLYNMLSSMTGRNSQDLTDYLGVTKAVYTSEGMATFTGTNVRFDYSVYKDRSDVIKQQEDTAIKQVQTDKGVIKEIADPAVNGLSHFVISTTQSGVDWIHGLLAGNDSDSIHIARDQEKIVPELSSPGVDITGRDGTGKLIVGPQVYLNGFITDKYKENTVKIGDFQTLISKNARMEYEPSTGRVYLAFYTLGSALPGSINGIEVSNSNNKDANGKAVNSIRLDKVNPVVGANEADVAKLNAALKTLQKDGGFQMFETEKYLYYFTTDAKGNNILRICEKAVGTCRDVQISGITRDGNNITVQTPEGAYKFNFGTDQRGNPTVQVDGPNGFQDFSKLISARSPGGILLFDPNNGWQLLNAQDIPWDKKMQQNGVSFYANPDGTVKGVADTNLLANQQVQGNDVASNFLANLPGVPKTFYGMMAFTFLLLFSVFFIRAKYD